jgi:hypothetical protein
VEVALFQVALCAGMTRRACQCLSQSAPAVSNTGRRHRRLPNSSCCSGHMQRRSRPRNQVALPQESFCLEPSRAGIAVLSSPLHHHTQSRCRAELTVDGRTLYPRRKRTAYKSIALAHDRSVRACILQEVVGRGRLAGSQQSLRQWSG